MSVETKFQGIHAADYPDQVQTKNGFNGWLATEKCQICEKYTN